MRANTSGLRKAGLAVLILVSLVLVGGLWGQQTEETAPQAEATEGKIRPAPQNITEKVEICVFLAWIWGMILLLIFVLRHKIKEVDRLHEIRYFPTKGKGAH
jgi:hypothetical protein